jgi:hypothetical protein
VTCTLALIAQLAGQPVAAGGSIDVPRWRYEQASHAERSHAKACLRRFRIAWRIVGER